MIDSFILNRWLSFVHKEQFLGHAAVSQRRKEGNQPYLPTEPKSGGFAPPVEKQLPDHLLKGHKTKLALIYRLLSKEPPSFACPMGCEIVSPMAFGQADVLVVEDFSDVDLKVDENTNIVLYLAPFNHPNCVQVGLLNFDKSETLAA